MLMAVAVVVMEAVNRLRMVMLNTGWAMAVKTFVAFVYINISLNFERKKV